VPETDIERELVQLEAELRQLEAEYNMYFAGRMPRPPLETRRRVDQHIRRLDRTALTNYAERFRFSTLQARFIRFTELWDRGLRAREEGRPGPFGAARSAAPPSGSGGKAEEQVLHVASFTDPGRETAKLRELYEQLVEARRGAGEEPVPFERFSQSVTEQVRELKARGAREVAVRIAVKAGKVNVSARGLRGA
jgi:hypothetical protein